MKIFSDENSVYLERDKYKFSNLVIFIFDYIITINYWRNDIINTKKNIKIMIILFSIIFLVLNFHLIIKAEAITIYVNPGESIQTAIDNANPGDTVFVHNGIYYENLIIDKTIKLLGENKNTTIIDDNTYGNIVMVFDAYNITITGFTFQNSSGLLMQGLLIWNASNNQIYNNIFKNNYIGVKLDNNSFNNIIYHNYLINNTYNAIDNSECNNKWDDTSRGNYWDDYTGSGPYTLTGPNSCQDRFPLTLYTPSPNNLTYCRELGYFIDENNDGIYDLFYSNQTGIKTITEKQNDGSYLINNDMDNDWDYTYNFQTGILKSYSSENTPPKKLDTQVYYLLIIGMIIVIILLVAIALVKKGKKEAIVKETKEEEILKETKEEEHKKEEMQEKVITEDKKEDLKAEVKEERKEEDMQKETKEEVKKEEMQEKVITEDTKEDSKEEVKVEKKEKEILKETKEEETKEEQVESNKEEEVHEDAKQEEIKENNQQEKKEKPSEEQPTENSEETKNNLEKIRKKIDNM